MEMQLSSSGDLLRGHQRYASRRFGCSQVIGDWDVGKVPTAADLFLHLSLPTCMKNFFASTWIFDLSTLFKALEILVLVFSYGIAVVYFRWCDAEVFGRFWIWVDFWILIGLILFSLVWLGNSKLKLSYIYLDHTVN